MKFVNKLLTFKYVKKAKDILSDPKKLGDLAKKSYNKFQKEKIEKEKDKFVSLVNLIKDFAKGEYRDINTSTVVYLIAALLYFINPLDLIPDFILSIGFLDDLSVLGFIYNKYSKEIEKYQEWKSKQTDSQSQLIEDSEQK